MPIDAANPTHDPGPMSRRFWLLLDSLVLLFILTRVAGLTIWWSDAATDPDAYVGIAQALSQGDGFCSPGTKTPTAYRPPLYPWLLAIRMTDNPNPLSNAQIVCSYNGLFELLLTVTLLCWGYCVHKSLLIGSFSAWAVGLDPLLIRATPLAMTEPCFTLLTGMALVFLFWLNANDTSFCLTAAQANHRGGLRPPARLISAFASGFTLGLAALCRPTIWPFIGLYSLGLLIVQRHRWRDAVRSLAALWLTLIVVVSPWVIRNQLVMGHPILTTTHGGYTLLLGNNPVFYDEVARKPWGTVWDGGSLDRWQRTMLGEMDADLGPGADEYAKDRWQQAKAWRHIQDDPAGFGWAVWYRVRSFWSLSPRGKGGESLPAAVRWLVAGWYAALFGLAISGTVIWWRERQPGLWVLLLFIASIQGMHLIYWTDTRMRAPLHPVLALLAAVAIERLWRRWSAVPPVTAVD